MPKTTEAIGLRPLLRAWVAVAIVTALTSACVSRPTGQVQAVEHAWVQADEAGGWVVRAVAIDGKAPQPPINRCPVIAWDAGSTAMSLRVAPIVVPTRSAGGQAESKPSIFTASVCEAPWPPGATSLRVADIVLQAPPKVIRRILVLGDSGCRMKASENAFQDCLIESRWPFAAVARAAAAKHPDLIVHLGDLHYRESPCPAGRSGCAGSPWGYGQDAWEADFFVPAKPLLTAAPWLFVRGNHESCARAGVGWFRLLDAGPWSRARSCIEPADDRQAEYSEPFAVPIDADTQLIVFDSSFVSGKPYAKSDASFVRYSNALDQVEHLSRQRPHNLFLNHHPVLGFAGSASGAPKSGNGGLMSVMSAQYPQRLYADGIDLVLNGHVHLFEAIGFASAHPSTLVLGNSGSQMEGHLDDAKARAAQPAPGAVVQTFVTQSGFGFATLDREAAEWRLTEWSVGGVPLVSCSLVGARLRCPPAP